MHVGHREECPESTSLSSTALLDGALYDQRTSQDAVYGAFACNHSHALQLLLIELLPIDLNHHLDVIEISFHSLGKIISLVFVYSAALVGQWK